MDTDLKSVVEFYRRVLAGQGGSELSMVCADKLERGSLDYGLESLHAIDRYLHSVHAAQERVPSIAYTNAIMGTAFYVGEVIRRGSPSTEYRWGRSEAVPMKESPPGVALNDLSDVVLLSHSVGDAIVPADAVFRVIRHGAKAPTIHSFAVASIRRAWMAAPP